MYVLEKNFSYLDYNQKQKINKYVRFFCFGRNKQQSIRGIRLAFDQDVSVLFYSASAAHFFLDCFVIVIQITFGHPINRSAYSHHFFLILKKTISLFQTKEKWFFREFTLKYFKTWLSSGMESSWSNPASIIGVHIILTQNNIPKTNKTTQRTGNLRKKNIKEKNRLFVCLTTTYFIINGV